MSPPSSVACAIGAICEQRDGEGELQYDGGTTASCDTEGWRPLGLAQRQWVQAARRCQASTCDSDCSEAPWGCMLLRGHALSEHL